MITINGNRLERDFEFSGGERQIRLGDLGIDRGLSTISVDAKVKNSNDMMTLLLVLNAIQLLDKGNSPVYVYLWYLPYARQDRDCYPGEANGSAVMRDLLGLMPADTIYVADVHSPQMFPINVTEVPCHTIFEDNREMLEGITALVSPDEGSSVKVSRIAEMFNLPVVYCRKTRDCDTGVINGVEVMQGDYYIDQGDLLVVDDICDGGGTFLGLAEELKRYSKFKSLSLYVTHGIFSRGPGILLREYDNIFTTDSFYEYTELTSDRIKVINL